MCRQGPFNKKENAFVIIMASAAANSALGTEVLAVQRLYYNMTPNAAASVFLLFSSQLLGYGIGGMMRCKYSFRHLTRTFEPIAPVQPFCSTRPKCCIPQYFPSSRCSMHCTKADRQRRENLRCFIACSACKLSHHNMSVFLIFLTQ